METKYFNIVDERIEFNSQNTNLLPPKPKSTFRHLKQGIQEFHRKYILVPAGQVNRSCWLSGRASASKSGGRGFESQPRDTKGVKNGTSGYFAWCSAL